MFSEIKAPLCSLAASENFILAEATPKAQYTTGGGQKMCIGRDILPVADNIFKVVLQGYHRFTSKTEIKIFT